MKLRTIILLGLLFLLFDTSRIDAVINQTSEADKIDSIEYKNGRKLFSSYCAVCHSINIKIVGPPLNDIQTKRPEIWIKHYLDNDEEFSKIDSIAKSFRAKQTYIDHPNFDTILSEKNVNEILYFIAKESKKIQRKK